ncbi:MAG: acetyl-CoA carboxylase biotin carboxyl carrier protein [Calditrichaeota bacterium]|nr:acetyl-CoA carboxylase biotin carboxyl carrier protein [Calditrichota bacterium]
MNYADIKRLVRLVESSDIAELELGEGESRVRIAKSNTSGQATAIPFPAMFPIPAGMPPASAAPVTPATAPDATAAAPVAAPARKLIEVQSPMVGTFYLAPAPEAPPYVQPGDQVKPGKVLCIIEAMKLMNEIEAEVSGRIVEALVENAQPVEFGQVLFRIDPA